MTILVARGSRPGPFSWRGAPGGSLQVMQNTAGGGPVPGPLPHLETFALAAEAGSFTAAARALGVTQAAVSGRIAALEHEMGVALFTRQAGRVQLTACGHRLY